MCQCVACGQEIEWILAPYTLASGRVVQSWFKNHHCSERFENMRQGIDRREREPYERVPNFAMRLNAGFSLLSQAGD